MALYKEILAHALAQEEIQITFANINFDAVQIVENECYKALQKIKGIIEDNTLEDSECFLKIEEIICALEEIGSQCGTRHDFG